MVQMYTKVKSFGQKPHVYAALKIILHIFKIVVKFS